MPAFVRSYPPVWQGENATPVVAPHSPVARDHPSRDRVGFFIPPHCDCSIKEQHYLTPSRDLRSALLGREGAPVGRLVEIRRGAVNGNRARLPINYPERCLAVPSARHPPRRRETRASCRRGDCEPPLRPRGISSDRSQALATISTTRSVNPRTPSFSAQLAQQNI